MSELQKLLNATTESGIKKADLEDFGKKIIKETLLQAHPVGSIEIRVDNVNPSTLYGGTWEKIEGKFLLGSSSSYTLGKSGGSATHTLTINEIPAHTHNIYSGYGVKLIMVIKTHYDINFGVLKEVDNIGIIDLLNLQEEGNPLILCLPIYLFQFGKECLKIWQQHKI